ncbi:MAG: hypothetical protein H0X73_08930 [Chthoniobacterales bacterium]|nr:hypothetical protein [Chthoniobacterales bacterium]
MTHAVIILLLLVANALFGTGRAGDAGAALSVLKIARPQGTPGELLGERFAKRRL